jgi:cobalt-zinc-cadmium efflux system membrane fusion protein
MTLSPSSALAALAIAAAALAGCKEAPAPAAQEPAAPIVQDGQLRFAAGHPHLAWLKTAPASPGRAFAVELPARLVWDEQHTQRIVPSFAGRVSRIEADVGQVVPAGAVLARLESPDFGAAQADAAKAAADAALAEKSLARQRELLDLGIAARKELEQTEADAARAGAELARARARVQLYAGGSAVDQRLVLRSSIPGIVVERNLNPGQDLRPDPYGPGVPPLFVVTDPSTLWVLIDAREADVGTLRPGAVFRLSVPAFASRTFEGRVAAVSEFIDPATRTIKVRGVVANRDRLLRAEMLATVRFDRQLGDGVVVPASALFLDGTRQRCFVEAAPGSFEPRDVAIGWQDSRIALVSSGLEVGDRVVVDNVLLLARQFRLAQEEAPPAEPASAASR